MNWRVLKCELSFLGHVGLSRKKRQEAPAHQDAFARSWPSLGRRGARRPGTPLVHPGARTHGESGAETPQRVSGMARASYRPFDDSVPWWLRVDVRKCTRRAVHTQSKRKFPTHYKQQKQQEDNNDILPAAAADRPNSSSSSTQQQRRRRSSGGGQLRANEPPIVRLMTPCLRGCALLGSVTFALLLGHVALRCLGTTCVRCTVFFFATTRKNVPGMFIATT